MRSLNIKYIPELDQLRGLAALLVLVFHAIAGARVADHYLGRHDAIPIAHNPFELFIINGSTGVALFFVLSGFLFTWGALQADRIDWKKFYINRVLRIFPLYILILMVAFSLDRGNVTFGSLLQSLTGFGNFTKAQGDFEIVLWTIAIELQFYLIFPFLIQLLKNKGARYLGGVIGILILVRLIAWADHISINDAVYYTLLGRLDQFLVGMILAWQVHRRGWLSASALVVAGRAKLILTAKLAGGLVLALAAMLGLFWLYTHLGWKYGESAFQAVWTPLEAAVWAGFGICYVGLVRLYKPKLATVIQFVGMISYSVYLLHYPIIRALHASGLTIEIPGHRLLSGFVTIGVEIIPITIAISLLTYYVIERPPLDLRKRYT